MLTDEIKEAIEKHLVSAVTASSNGTPNVVPIGFTRPIHNKRMLIIDVMNIGNFEEKTRYHL